MAPRKRQTSCEACRRARIGCNAATETGDSCYNCVRRGIACTFPGGLRPNGSSNHRQQIENATTSDSESGHLRRQPSEETPVTPSVGCGTEDSLSQTQQASRLHDILWEIFITWLEPRMGMWIGAECCPFKTPTNSGTTLVSRLMVTLDAASRNGDAFQRNESDDRMINRALMSAVYAYSARWLFLDDLARAKDDSAKMKLRKIRHELTTSLYIRSYRWLPAAISRCSYRSILALHLGAHIRTSSVSEREGVTRMYLQAALNHHILLRSRERRNVARGSPVAVLKESISKKRPNPGSSVTKVEVSGMEDVAYWFGGIADTSRALLHCMPPLLMQTRSGESTVWSHVRRKIVGFDAQFRYLHKVRAPIPDEQVMMILQNAFASKLLCWSAIVQVQDAVLHQTGDAAFEEALRTVQEANNQFEDVFTPLLDLCRRDFILFRPTVQLCYTLVNIHFQVGSLILADLIDGPPIFADSGLQSYDLRVCACRTIVNAVKLALEADSKSPALSILLLDPYPEYMIDALIRTASSLLMLLRQELLHKNTVTSMIRPIVKALEILSEISYIAAEALPLIQSRSEDIGVGDLLGNHESPAHPVISSAGPKFDHNLCDEHLLRELERKVSADPNLIGRSIERTESDIFISSILEADFSTPHLHDLGSSWEFDRCFFDGTF